MFETSNLRRIAGKRVVAKDGDRIGKVVDVYESTAADGRGTFATVATGLFGTSASFFPLDAAELRDDELVVPYTKEFVKHAPRVDNDAELTSTEEDRLFEYYGLAGSAVSPGTAPTTAERGLGGDTGELDTDGAMTRSEERLRVGTERVEAGRARLRKYVVTETVTRTVPVSHQELRISREPIAPGTEPAHGGGPLSEEVHELVLTADRPVVHKEVVPVERVRLDTVTVDEQEIVTEEVRKEQIAFEGDGAADPAVGGHLRPGDSPQTP